MTKTRNGSSSNFHGSKNRNVIHGTAMGKSGRVGRGDSRNSKHLDGKGGPDSKSMRGQAQVSLQHKNFHRDTTIVAPPPKPVVVLATSEKRFTIPDSPQNSAIRQSQLRRTSATQALVLRELEMELQCRAGQPSPRITEL